MGSTNLELHSGTSTIDRLGLAWGLKVSYVAPHLGDTTLVNTGSQEANVTSTYNYTQVVYKCQG